MTAAENSVKLFFQSVFLAMVFIEYAPQISIRMIWIFLIPKKSAAIILGEISDFENGNELNL